MFVGLITRLMKQENTSHSSSGNEHWSVGNHPVQAPDTSTGQMLGRMNMQKWKNIGREESLGRLQASLFPPLQHIVSMGHPALVGYRGSSRSSSLPAGSQKLRPLSGDIQWPSTSLLGFPEDSPEPGPYSGQSRSHKGTSSLVGMAQWVNLVFSHKLTSQTNEFAFPRTCHWSLSMRFKRN